MNNLTNKPNTNRAFNRNINDSNNKKLDCNEETESKTTNMSLENNEVKEEFSLMIKKLKQISREIDNNITKEQVIIDNQNKQMEEIQENVENTKYKLMNFMEKSSNTCLIISIVIEILVLVMILISI